MGYVKPWLWEKNPCFIALLFCHLYCLSTSLMLHLVVDELWLRAFIAEVVVVVGGCQPYPISHSTHVAHSSPSRTLPWLVFTLSPRFLVCWLLTHRLWAILVSCKHFLRLHELLKHPRTVIRILAVVLFIHGKNRSCFLLTQGLYCWNPHAENWVCLSRAFFCWVRVFPHAQDAWVVFPMP